MEKTPVLKTKLSSIQNHRAKDIKNISFSKNDLNSVFEMDNEESPVQIACTQDGSENIDVVWDWNSPQAKKHPKKCQKRLLLPQSPKIPLKKFPSNNSIQHFEKLREELQALRQEIALPENEDSLRLSPREEADYKNIHNSPVNKVFDDFDDECFDMFDDKLIEFSENIENKFTVSTNEEQPKFKKIHSEENVLGVNSANQKISFKKNISESHMKIANDSFESLLGDIDVETLTCPISEKVDYSKHSNAVKTNSYETRSNKLTDLLTQVDNSKTIVRVDEYEMGSNIYHTNSGKVEFHRTQSFELTNSEHSTDLPRCKLEEIEKKRREARAKLELKRKHDKTAILSQSQCSMTEIENKRLQALAKLEAKRQQDIIERKRQEALKKLQTNRKKNALVVKSSLTNRLD
ncbi:unnamed protein product [Phaedon cochleariae]|uniref:Uncharacterized protein n=1 Tax=Phaedon cochleariae TaxID=80249 RepID=A0A9P0DTK3_PHACE|nr:unnamed protein product [Phaedon cochleariae]